MAIIPYVSPQEFTNAPTGLNLQTLVPTGTSADNSAELMRVLLRASGWIDNFCNQQLRATVNTEIKHVWVGRDGYLSIFPNYWPIISLSSLSYRVYPQQGWMTIDPTQVDILPNRFWATGLALPATLRVTVQYTYTNGWPVSSLSSAVSAGATTLPLTNTTGIVSGTLLTVYDGINTEQVTVSSVAGSNVTVSAPIAYAHAAGIHVSSLPDEVREACILVASAFIRDREAGDIVMMTQTGHISPSDSNQVEGLDQAKEMLQKYRRVI
jgi:hypothetical protein